MLMDYKILPNGTLEIRVRPVQNGWIVTANDTPCVCTDVAEVEDTVKKVVEDFLEETSRE